MRKLLIFTCITAGLVACNNHPVAQAAIADVPDTVAVFILRDTSIAKSMELPAELLPYEQAALFARVQGYVKEMKVDLGDRVRRGQTLALIEAPELQTKYAEFQSSLESAKAKFQSSADFYQRMYRASQAKQPALLRRLTWNIAITSCWPTVPLTKRQENLRNLIKKWPVTWYSPLHLME